MRIVKAGRADVMPWTNPSAFARTALDMARADLAAAAQMTGPVFFDRGMIDAACELAHLTGETIDVRRLYNARVFFAPPWPEIHETTDARRHGYDEALGEVARLRKFAPENGYRLIDLPLVSVTERAAFVLTAVKNKDDEHTDS